MTTPGLARPGTIVLPHLERVVPLLYGPGGRLMVPMYALCQMLGLDAALEIRRAQRVLLWVAASLLPIPQGGEVRYVWCLPYPPHVVYWFGQVYGHMYDPALRKRLLPAIKDTDRLAGRASWHLQDCFAAGRQRMRQLPLSVQSIGDLIARLQDNVHVRLSKSDHDSLAVLALRYQALREQAATFVRGWFADAQQLPVVDAVRLDEGGHVLGEPMPFTLFGVFSDEDSAQLSQYERAFAALREELDHLANGLDEG